MRKKRNEIFRWANKHIEFWGFAKITCGTWLLYLSSLYLSGSGNYLLKLTMWPDMPVFFLFGAITAYLYHYYYGIMYGNGLSLASILSFIADTLAYTAFYSIVLFPLSGFGVIQWLLLIYILFSSLVIKRDGSISRYFQPLALFLFGALMFVLKSFVQYLFPVNIYQEFISGNSSVRWVIFAITGIAACYQLVSLFSSRKASQAVQVKSKTSQTLSFLGAQAKTGIRFALTAGFILPFLGVFVAVGLTFGFVISKAQYDFWRILGPLLNKALTTDRVSIMQSQSLAFFQLAAFALFVLYFFLAQTVFEGYLQEGMREIRKRIKIFYPEEVRKGLEIKDPLIAITQETKLYDDIEEYFQTADEFSCYGERHNRIHIDDERQADYEEFKEKYSL